MNCPKCRSANNEEATFCHSCGGQLPKAAPLPPKPPAPILSSPAPGSGMQQQFQKAQAAEGVKTGDIVMTGSSMTNTTSNDSHDNYNVQHNHGAPAVSGVQNINIQSGGVSELVLAEMLRRDQERGHDPKKGTVRGEKCPICGALAKDDYFACGVCNKDFICNRHMHQHQHEFMCVKCAHGRGLLSAAYHPTAPTRAQELTSTPKAAPLASPPNPLPQTQPIEKKSSGAMIGIAAAVVVALGVGGFLAMRKPPVPPAGMTQPETPVPLAVLPPPKVKPMQPIVVSPSEVKPVPPAVVSFPEKPVPPPEPDLRARYIDIAALRPGSKVVAFRGDPLIAREIFKHLPQPVSSTAFTNAFYQDGLFDQLLLGDTAKLQSFRLGDMVDTVYVIKIWPPETETPTNRDGFTFTQVRVQFEEISPREGAVLKQTEVTLEGRGFSPREALAEVKTDVESKVQSLL